MAFKKGLWRKIKLYQIYDKAELCRLLGIDISTLYNWIRKHGLHPVNPGEKNALFEGKDIVSFLKKWGKERKVPLKPNEYYCFKCKVAVLPKTELVDIKPSGTYNADGSQTMINGSICSICDGEIHIFKSGKI